MTKSLKEQIAQSLNEMLKNLDNQPLDTLIETLEDTYEKMLVADYLEKRMARRNALQKRVLNKIEEEVAAVKAPIATPKVAEPAPEQPKIDSTLNPEIKVLKTPEGPPPMPNHDEPDDDEPAAEKTLAAPKSEPAPVAKKQAPKPAPAPAPKPQPTVAPEVKKPASIAEKAQTAGAKKSLNERFAGQKLSFGLNDRLAYVKHLFDGSSEDFNRVVSQLNTMEDWEEADSFINEMVKPDFNWAEKEEYEERFMTHLRTRFE